MLFVQFKGAINEETPKNLNARHANKNNFFRNFYCPDLGEKEDKARWECLVKAFEQGLAPYRVAKWDEAAAAFQEALAVHPEAGR